MQPVNICTKDVARIGDKYYFLAEEMNLLGALNLATGQNEIVDSVPEKCSLIHEPFGSIVSCGAELYISPVCWRNVWIYNTVSKEWKSLTLPKREIIAAGGKIQSGIIQGFTYDGAVYFIGSCYPAIVRIDPATKNLHLIEAPFLEKGVNHMDGFSRAHHVVIGDTLYSPCCFDNTVLKMNLKTEEYEWVHLGGAGNRYSGVAYDGKYMWFSPRLNSPIVRWDGADDVREYPLPEEYGKEDYYFFGAVYDGKDIIICAYPKFNSIRIKPDGQFEIENHYFWYADSTPDEMAWQDENGHFQVFRKGQMVIDTPLTIDLDELLQHYKDRGLPLFDSQYPMAEGAFMDLKNFLKIVDETST